jgi:predicted ATP-grasp superfamily ATP-dependent carboligase
MKTNRSDAPLSPAFVLNPFYTGIGIARNLYGHGVKVYGLYFDKKAPGVRSRFFHEVYRVPDSRDEPEALCERLIDLAKQHRAKPVIFPTRDFDVLFLQSYREKLDRYYHIPQPEGEAITNLLDKAALVEIAGSNQVAVPKTVVCKSKQDLERCSLRFPVVIKPRSAHEWRRNGAWEKVGAQKAVCVQSRDQLMEKYRQLSSVTETVLLQEYVAGMDSDIAVCCCYLSKSGELLGYFTAKKLRQNPPLFGTGCAVQAVAIPAIVTPSVKILQAAGYAGLAEVEFKYDEPTNTYFLIEINTRHWDQHELGRLVGINLTWVAYQAALGLSPQPQLPEYSESFQCKWIAERELVWLFIRNILLKISALRQSRAPSNPLILVSILNILKTSAVEFAGLVRGHTLFGVLHWRDPLPSALLCLQLFSEMSKRISSHLWKAVVHKKHSSDMSHHL